MITRLFIFTSLTLVLQAQTVCASASHDVKKANALFEESEFDEALLLYRKALNELPESHIINYNLGTALYKSGQYDGSIQHLQKALLAEDETLKQKASYNLANALYHSGIAKQYEDSGFAVLSLEKALGHLEEALRVEQNDEDARHNYDFIKQEIERIKKMQTQGGENQQSSQSQDQENQKNQQEQDQQQKPDNQQQQAPSQGQSDQPEDSEQNQDDSLQKQDDPSGKNSQDPSDNQKPKQDEQNNDGDEEGGGDQSGDEKEEKEEQKQSSDSQKQQEREDVGEKNQQEGDEKDPQPDYNNQAQQGTQGDDEGELTQTEAQMLLRGFEQTEQPQKLLNVFKGKSDSTPVDKDW